MLNPNDINDWDDLEELYNSDEWDWMGYFCDLYNLYIHTEEGKKAVDDLQIAFWRNIVA